MNSDAAFTIGKTHQICQDYTAAKINATERHTVALADGCSSSANSDIGARLLVQAALSANESSVCEPVFFERALRQSAACVDLLGLDPVCLDATLLVIQATKERFTLACYGDGVLCLGRRGGGLDLYSVAFDSGYPGYPSYQLDSQRAGQWAVQDGGSRTLTRWSGLGEAKTTPVQEAVVRLSGQCADYAFAAALSDGIHSFSEVREAETGKVARPVSIWDAATRLLAFKSAKGQFVQRRMAAFGRERLAQNWQHSDDLSIGAVWFGEE